MFKRIFLCLICFCLAACYAKQKVQPLSAPAAGSAPQAQITSQFPVPQADSAAAETSPFATAQTNQTTASADASPLPAAQAAPASDQTALSAPASAPASVPTSPQPAADKAVFEDEKLIDFEGRMLHPYAALSPNSQAKQTAPWAYEQLKYGIYYTFIKAGTAYIRNRGLVDINGHAAYLLQTTAFSAPVIDAFFKVRDINQSWLDAETFYSLGYGQSVREGGYVRDEWLTFDYPRRQYSGLVRKKEEPRPISGPLEMNVVDILTSLYYVRSQQLEPGKDLVFDIVNREKQYPLIVKVLKKEKVKTDAGTFDCIVVEPQLRGEGIFVSKGKSLKVWLTDDEYKMPVKMQVEVFIGSVSAKLLEYKRQEPTNIL